MSQQALLAPYQSLGEKNIVPAYTRYENPSRQNVVIARDKVSFVPTSGSSYTVGGTSGNSNQISFLLSDASRFIDLPTAALCFDYVLTRTDTPNNSTAAVLPTDNAVSLFNRVQVKLNGILLEDIVNLNVAFNSRMQTNMNKDFYEANMDNLAGSWVYNQHYGGAQVSPVDVATRLGNAIRTQYNGTFNNSGGAAAATISRSFAVPLGFLSGLFQLQKLLPLPLMNTLEINCYFDNILNSHYAPTAPAANAISFTLTNVRIMADLCEMRADYGQLMKQICYNDDSGLNIAFDTTQAFQLNYAATNNTTSNLQLVFNKASPFVRSVLCSKSRSTDIGNIQAMYPLNFLNGGNKGVRISVGSIYNPLFGSTENNAITYAMTKSGDLQNVISGGLQNASTYSGVSWDAGTSTLTNDSLLANFTFQFDFDKLTNGEVEKDGLDSSALGSAFVVYVNETPKATESRILNVFIHYTRHLSMRGGVLSCSG